MYNFCGNSCDFPIHRTAPAIIYIYIYIIDISGDRARETFPRLLWICALQATPLAVLGLSRGGTKSALQAQSCHMSSYCIFTHFESIFGLVYFFLARDSCVQLQRCGNRTPQQRCNTNTDSCARNLLASWMHAVTLHTSPSAAKRAPQGQLATRLSMDLEHTNTHMHYTWA